MTSEQETLQRHRQIWQKRPVLRALYQEWYAWIAESRSTVNGVSLEIGSGSGNLTSSLQKIYASDIVSAPWLDLTLDAVHLPFENSSLGNLIGFDALHHMTGPLRFFKEATRCLKPGGRLILIEPYLTPFSRLVWRFHPEPIDFNIDFFEDIPQTPPVLSANQAVSYLLFKKHLVQFLAAFQQLKLIRRKPFSYLAYPLSGGFDKKQMLPSSLFPLLMDLDRRLDFMAEWCAFRILVVLERQ
ncbi:MAG: class I SAM-dependent methyltransferase [Candidatus Omnitrophica bacterium]|nr:class I SAM-dependent methyltransferase [Candidatus Omnitrophota bacterium]